MPITYTDNGGGAANGSDLEFTFTFPVLQTEDVKVALNGVTQATTKYTVDTASNPTKITFNNTTIDSSVQETSGAPKSGVLVRVYRQTTVGKSTGDDDPKAVYAAGSSIRAVDLNSNTEQALYAIHELQNNPVLAEQIDTGAITSDKILDGTIATADIADNAITSAKILSGNVLTSKINDGAVTNIKLADDSVDSRNYIDNSIDTQHIADNQITSAKIADGNVLTSKIADANVTTAKLATDAVTSAKIADDQINSEHYVDGSIDTAHIADAQITTAKIVDANVTTAKIAADAVNSTKIADDSIDSEHYVDGSIDTAHIGNNQVTTAKIADANITTAKIATNAVTTDKIADGELTTLAGMQSTTASNLASATALTATTAELNQLDGITLETSVTTNSDTRIPTSKAVNDLVLSVTNALGGFVAIANETSFPTTNPDPSNNAGTVVSISQLSTGLAVNGSGVATISNGAGTGNTVTITGFPSNLQSQTLPASSGLQVQTTSTLHTYTFHKQLASAADIQAISATVNSFSNRYRVSASAPTSSLDGGDLWYDTTNSKLMVYSSQNSAWEESSAIGNFFISTISSSSSTGGGSATANGTAYRFTISNAPTDAQQLLVSVDGVIQKPNAGSSQPSEGFVLVGNDIIFGAPPANGASMFVTVIGSTVGIGTPSNNTVTTAILQNGSVTTAKIVDANVTTDKIANGAISNVKIADGSVTGAKIANGTIVNGDVNASAAIAGTKISPDFGSQNVVTTGKLGIGTTSLNSVFPLTIQAQYPGIQFLDAQGTDAFGFNADGNTFRIQKGVGGSGPTVMLEMASGSSTFSNNLNANAGLDVTGAITATDHVSINADSKRFMAGASNDARMYHDGNDSYFDSVTGHLYLFNNASNKDIIFGVGGANKWRINSSGALRPNADSSVDIGTNTIRVANGYFDTLYGDGSNLTGVSSVGGSTGVDFNDTVKARFGNSNDLAIFHDGNNSYIQDSGQGNLILQGTEFRVVGYNTGESAIHANENGSVELYENGTKRFHTTSSGAYVTGNFTATASSYINGTLNCQADDDTRLRLNVPSNNSDDWNYISFYGRDGNRDAFMGTWSDGTPVIYSDASGGHFIKFHSGSIEFNNHLLPNANNSLDLGSNGSRWRNIYTNDLHLSNENSSNDVDGTWGDWTIQEGESDLFLKNNRSGKKYKFNLTEVS